MAIRCALAMLSLFAVDGFADGLDRYRWKSRLVVILDGKPGEGLEKRQRALLVPEAELRERDVVVLPGSASERRALGKALGVPEGRFETVLVGKDGDVKGRWTEPVPWETLRKLIDAMPMRRREAER
jgi:hypothetical protein